MKLIKWHLRRCYYVSHFHSRHLSLWRRCGVLWRLHMECVITNIHCPVFPKCYILPSVVTRITPFRKDRLAVLPSLATFPSSTIHIHVVRYVREGQATSYMNYTKKYRWPQRVPVHVEGRRYVKTKRHNTYGYDKWRKWHLHACDRGLTRHVKGVFHLQPSAESLFSRCTGTFRSSCIFDTAGILSISQAVFQLTEH